MKRLGINITTTISKFTSLRLKAFSTKSQRRDNLKQIAEEEIIEISDSKSPVDKGFLLSYYSVNIPFYLTSIYLLYMRTQLPLLPDQFTMISRICLNALNISQCIHSGLSIGCVTRKNLLVESTEDQKASKHIKRYLIMNYFTSISSFCVTQVLLTSSITGNFQIHIGIYGLIALSQYYSNYYGVNKKFIPQAFLIPMRNNVIIFSVFLLMLYLILKDKTEYLKRVGDINRIEDLKTLDDIILEEEDQISNENNEIMRNEFDLLNKIYNQDEKN